MQHENLGPRCGPELRSTAPLRCGEEKGHPELCGRRLLQAQKSDNQPFVLMWEISQTFIFHFDVGNLSIFHILLDSARFYLMNGTYFPNILAKTAVFSFQIDRDECFISLKSFKHPETYCTENQITCPLWKLSAMSK